MGLDRFNIDFSIIPCSFISFTLQNVIKGLKEIVLCIIYILSGVKSDKEMLLYIYPISLMYFVMIFYFSNY